ncbi:hypothetical protein KAR91_79110 [Candidatus Pacearchaeota archaeon]|nr:hypothetical protein [Candidatus Pacearchaeota archaeon]
MNLVKKWKINLAVKSLSDEYLRKFSEDAKVELKERIEKRRNSSVSLLKVIIAKEYFSSSHYGKEKTKVWDAETDEEIKYPTEKMDLVLESSYMHTTDVIRLLRYMSNKDRK